MSFTAVRPGFPPRVAPAGPGGDRLPLGACVIAWVALGAAPWAAAYLTVSAIF